MPAPADEENLSRINTLWTVLREANRPDEDTAVEQARQELMQRYCGAVYRYILGGIRDPHAAEDLTQEFALRFIQGRFRHADPGRGRFRDYVKTALFHMVSDYRRRQARQKAISIDDGLDPSAPIPSSHDAIPADDKQFLDSWRQELLAKTWAALQEHEAATGQVFNTVLRYRVEHPDTPSQQMAEEIGARLGKPMSAANVRQLLHRARERFAEILLNETRISLGSADSDRLEDELAELNLLKYCHGMLPKRSGS